MGCFEGGTGYYVAAMLFGSRDRETIDFMGNSDEERSAVWDTQSARCQANEEFYRSKIKAESERICESTPPSSTVALCVELEAQNAIFRRMCLAVCIHGERHTASGTIDYAPIQAPGLPRMFKGILEMRNYGSEETAVNE